MRRSIKIGDSGKDVQVWQAYIGVTIDGNFGPITEQETRMWQLEHGLKDDGIVGPLTWAQASKRVQDVLNALEGNV
jgi:peptidoglycan hydrolase-like protein with peptidoglycan-binding domain